MWETENQSKTHVKKRVKFVYTHLALHFHPQMLQCHPLTANTDTRSDVTASWAVSPEDRRELWQAWSRRETRGVHSHCMCVGCGVWPSHYVTMPSGVSAINGGSGTEPVTLRHPSRDQPVDIRAGATTKPHWIFYNTVGGTKKAWKVLFISLFCRLVLVFVFVC